MARREFTTYINTMMDANAQRDFNALDQMADKAFSNVQKSADRALKGVDERIGRFRNSFDLVSKSLSSLTTGGLNSLGGLDFGVSGLRDAAAQARLYEEALRTTLRTAQMVKLETGDNSRATRDYINSLQTAVRAAADMTRQSEQQVRTFSNIQEMSDRGASSVSRLAASYRDLYAEQARQAQRGAADSVYAREYQKGINQAFAPGLGQSATAGGASYSALSDQADRQARLVSELNRGVAELERRFAVAQQSMAAEAARTAAAMEQERLALVALAEAESGAARGADMLAAIYRGTAEEMGHTTKSAQDMVSALNQAARENSELVTSAASLRSAMDPIAAVTDRYNQALAQVDRMTMTVNASTGQMIVSDREAARMKEYLTGQYEKNLAAARSASNGITGYGNSLRGNRFAIVQAGQQLQDIAIGFVSGQRGSTILAQQLPQLAYVMQDVGGKAGAIARLFAGPWGIALVFASMAAGGLVDKLLGLGKASDDAKGSTINFANAMETARAFATDYAGALGQLENATRSLIDTQDILVDRLAATSRQAADSLEATRATVGARLDELRGRDTGMLGMVPGFGLLPAEKAELAELESRYARIGENIQTARSAAARAATAIEIRTLEENADPDKKARADIRRQMAELRALRDETTQMGPVPVIGARSISKEDFDKQYNALIKQEKDLEESIKARSKAERDAASSAKRDAAEAARIAEARSKDAEMERYYAERLALQNRASTMSATEYSEALGVINQRNKDNLAAINATSTAGKSSIQTELEQLEKRSSEGERFAQTLDNIMLKYREMTPVAKAAAKDIATIFRQIDRPGDVRGLDFLPVDAEAKVREVMESLQRPYRDFLRDMERGNQILELQIGGYEDVARALQTAMDMQAKGNTIGGDQLRNILAQQQAQDALNDRYRVAQDIQNDILNIAEETRSATNNLIVGIARGDAKNALKRFGDSILDNVLQIQAKQITAELFAGASAELRGMISNEEALQVATRILEENADRTGTSLDQLVNNLTEATRSIGDFSDAIRDIVNQVAGGGGIGSTGGMRAEVAAGVSDAAQAMSSTVSQDRAVVSGLAGTAGSIIGGPAGAAVGTVGTLGAALINTNRAADTAAQAAQDVASSQDITVLGNVRQAEQVGAGVAKAAGLTVGQGYGVVMGKLANGIGDLVGGKGTFSAKAIGGAVGNALQGMGTGSMASGLFGAVTGVRQSGVGAAIGGALLGPIGGIIGGTLGGLLGKPKPKYGTAVIGTNEFGEYVGTAAGNRGSAQKAAALASAGAVGDQLQQIQDALGLQIDELAKVTIGTYDGKWRVSTRGATGKLDFKGNSAIGLYNFGKEGEEEAIAFAVQTILEKSVLSGVSQASINILKSGQDLTRALNKALAIEDIPKRLLQMTDPVRYAINQLNDEFVDLISYLKEGGATAEQFAEAQQLYDLERAKAIEEATNSTVEALRSFMANMIGSSSSPLSKRSVYSNAQSAFAELESQINAGQMVSQDKLLEAAQNFNDASRSIYGSSSSFFSDFDRIYDAIDRAASLIEDQASATGDLPGSPFATDDVASLIAGTSKEQVDATNNQTDVLSAKLDNLTKALLSTPWGASYIQNGGSAMALLQNFP